MSNLETGTKFAFQKKLDESEDFIRKVVQEQTDQIQNIMEVALNGMKHDMEEATVKIQTGQSPWQVEKIKQQHYDIQQLERIIDRAKEQGFECGLQDRVKKQYPWPENLKVFDQVQDMNGLTNKLLTLYDFVDVKNTGNFLNRVRDEIDRGLKGGKIDTPFISLLRYFPDKIMFCMEEKYSQCQYCMQYVPIKNIARHITRCKPDPYRNWINSNNALPTFQKGRVRYYSCIICGHNDTERSSIFSHLKH